MMGYGYGMGWAGWLMMGLTFLLFWGLVIGAGVWLVRNVRARPGDGPTRNGRAYDVLAERYARGEIDAEEFERRRSVLSDAAAR